MFGSQRFFGDRERATEDAFRIGVSAAVLIYVPQVVQCAGYLRMLGPQPLLDPQCPVEQHFRLFEPALIPMKVAETAECFGDVRVLGPKSLFRNLERPAVKPFGIVMPAE